MVCKARRGFVNFIQKLHTMKTVILPLMLLAVTAAQSLFAQTSSIDYKSHPQVVITYPYIGRIAITGNDEIRQTLIHNLGSAELADLVMTNSNEMNWPNELNAESKRKNYRDLISQLKCYKIAESGDVCILGVPAKQAKNLVKTFNIEADFFIPIDCQSLVSAD